MKNLRLLSRLQQSEMVTLMLVQEPGAQLQYFIITKSINYLLVSSGNCEGSIEGGMRTFNILMSSIYPLIEKGYELLISYKNNILEFATADDKIHIRPLCVEYYDPLLDVHIAKLQRFQESLKADGDVRHQLARAEQNLRDAQEHYDGVQKMYLEGAMMSSNPFGGVAGFQPLSDLEKDIKEKQDKLAQLQKQSVTISSVNLKPFELIIQAAARAHEMINFCDTYAVVSLKTTFLLQKGTCPAMSVHGTLLQQLLRYSDGEGFSWFENGLVYSVSEKTGESTALFMEKYLPNTSVDSGIVTRGVTVERHQLSVKGVLKITQLMKSKFPEMVFDLGAGEVVLGNDKGERIVTKFNVDDTETLQLIKLKRGEQLKGEYVSTSISVPVEVQGLLSLFKDQLTIYVKSNKIIFQAEDFYIVFGR